MNFQSLLTWITGRTPPEPPQKTVASEPASVERRRSSRLPISEGEAVIAEHPPFPISDVSFRGIRFEVPDGNKPAVWNIGTQLSATLKFGTVRIASQLKICNLWPTAVGCLFTGIAPHQSLRLA
ncbi:MAG TPA: hypothetical protein PKO06_05690, partial [Candidatus Ozemobacteraceae bacterium]|nr:hypothetical protein [Candidatus Ozemobacteraceae bacterium]